MQARCFSTESLNILSGSYMIVFTKMILKSLVLIILKNSLIWDFSIYKILNIEKNTSVYKCVDTFCTIYYFSPNNTRMHFVQLNVTARVKISTFDSDHFTKGHF